MRRLLPRRRLLALAAAAAALVAGSALAQNWPERPVKIVSVTSAGTGVDDFARLLAAHLSRKFGQNFYVEPKPGANTIIACDYVAKSAPDGYTLLLASGSSISANPFLFKSLPFDVNKDLVPVARLNALPVTLVVPATSPYRTLAELMAAGRARPGKLNYGTSSAGYRVMARAINGVGKVDAVDVPYKAMSNLLPELIGGTIDYTMLEVSAAVPMVQGGKLRALALSSPSRVPALPDVPTLAEAGAGEASLVSWVGLMAPSRTPAAVVDKVSKAAIEFLGTPEAGTHFAQRGTVAYPAAGAEFSKFIAQDQSKWKHYIDAAGIQPE